jgi:sterol desaturase/sphingolipid hydroxylase (fatty acid hydroxylase superfamily)
MTAYSTFESVRLLALPLVSLAVVVLLGRILEQQSPIDPEVSPSERRMEYKFAVANTALGQLLGPLTSACSAMIVSAAGGGWIELPSDGWWCIVTGLVVILVYDLFRYWSHRLYHAIPALWAMHSFHHSAEALTVATGVRHFWLESAIDSAFLPVVVIIFKVPPIIGALVPILYFLPDGCSHLNYRINLGRFVTWLNNPQWHRIHHSVLPEHRDKNFCSLLPLMDFLFGTAWIPAPDEYPLVTGLTPRETPGFWQGMLWPVRRLVFRKVPDAVISRPPTSAQINAVRS